MLVPLKDQAPSYDSMMRRQITPLKMGKGPDQTLLKEGIGMATGHMKRCSRLVIVRETRARTAGSRHFEPTRGAEVKRRGDSERR